MKEIIKNIQTTDVNEHEGYVITTDKQIIRVLISAEQQCCERSGYLSSEDNLSDFEGAQLLSIRIVDDALKSYDALEYSYSELESCAVFVNFETSKGLFQIAVYNIHNGYYGHDVYVQSNHLDFETII